MKGLLSWVLLPICLPQAFWVRAHQTRLLPPPGNTLRSIGASKDAPTYRVLVVGDSTVAGVGTANLEDGLAVRLAEGLSAALNRPISLRIAGNNSATTSDLRDHVVPHLPRDAFDLIVLVVGVNDAKNMRRVSAFSKSFGTLLYALQTRFPSALIAHCPIVPLQVIPLLPQPLKTLLSWRSDAIDAQAACLCASRGFARFTRHLTFPEEGFARDGFHVNESGCELWAGELVRELLAMPSIKAAVQS